MKCKRLMSVLLSMIMALGLLAGCGGSTASAADDVELQKAKVVGLLPEEWLSDMQKPVTIAEFNGLLTNIVEMRDPALVPEWKSVAEPAFQTDEVAQRDDVILSIFEAAVIMGIDKVSFNDVFDKWEGRVPDIDWWEGRSFDYDYFPNWNTIYDNGDDDNYNMQEHSAWYVQTHKSLISEKYIIEPTEEWRFQFDLDVSREEAARALVRFMECDASITYGERNYISVKDVGTYNKEIITDELLQMESDLPEVTQNKLPSKWNGIGNATRKAHVDQYIHFKESDIRFLAENGFNFNRMFYSFSTLRYPDFPADSRMINEKELEELDQLLAWCIKYGVHLQIAMTFYLDENGNELEAMPRTDAEWALVKDYWETLARRYADIPSKYLSFDLCNEISPQSMEDISYAKKGLSTVVNAVRKADADRVLLYSLPNYGDAHHEWAKNFTSMGVAIGYHPYIPGFLSTAGWVENELNPYAEACWPQPYFPAWGVRNGKAPIILNGEIGGSTLSLHALKSGENPNVKVSADGVVIDTIEFRSTEFDGIEYYYYDKIYSVNIPDGAKQVEILVENDWIYLDTLIVEKDGVKTVMVPSDLYGEEARTESLIPLPLTIHGDGTYSNSENSVIDEDYIYKAMVEPYVNIAKNNNVGFMINEFGVFGNWGKFTESGYFDTSLVAAHADTYLSMFQKYDIGWCFCEMDNLVIGFYGNPPQWSNSTVGEVTYTFDDGSTSSVKYCKELMDTFAKYTKG